MVEIWRESTPVSVQYSEVLPCSHPPTHQKQSPDTSACEQASHCEHTCAHFSIPFAQLLCCKLDCMCVCVWVSRGGLFLLLQLRADIGFCVRAIYFYSRYDLSYVTIRPFSSPLQPLPPP